MKNKIFSLLAIVALFGFTATAAQAHTHSHHHDHDQWYHHHFCRDGQWFDYYDDCPSDSGISIHFNF